ncbi:MAG: anion permease [Symbiopectobacterium sp.]
MYLFAVGAVDWKALLKDHAAWDTVIWFSVIISMATGLSDLGFIKWMAGLLGSLIHWFGTMETFVLLGVLYLCAAGRALSMCITCLPWLPDMSLPFMCLLLPRPSPQGNHR